MKQRYVIGLKNKKNKIEIAAKISRVLILSSKNRKSSPPRNTLQNSAKKIREINKNAELSKIAKRETRPTKYALLQKYLS
jgi:hypothetical protein